MANRHRVSDGLRNGKRGKCRAEAVASDGDGLARKRLELGADASRSPLCTLCQPLSTRIRADAAWVLAAHTVPQASRHR